MTIKTGLFIDGVRSEASDGAAYEVYNPANLDELVGIATNATAHDVERAVTAAEAAYPAWSALSYPERAECLCRAADALLADEQALQDRVALFTREHGKLRFEAEIEMRRIADRFREVAAFAPQLAEDKRLPGPPKDTIVTRQPRGVAALIVPWNWPLAILGAKLPQALIAGNTVVIKLSENAPLAVSQTVALVAAIFPPGVVNCLTGDSSRIGDPLLTHSNVRYINFTGSVRIGRHVMAKASENLTPVTLELGGNDAGLVLEDAVIDEEFAQNLYTAVFLTSGQVCMALKRLYVHRSRFDEVVAAMEGQLKDRVVGNGLDPDVTFAPVNNERQFKTVTEMIQQAREAGADVRSYGRMKEMNAKGYFIRPTLVIDPDPSLDVVVMEQFGPVLPILPFDTEEEAIVAANDSEFGLCSSVWTPDYERAVALSRQLDVGFTYLNGHGPTVQDGRAPFGGFKNSGFGRNFGYEGIVAFQGTHSISGPSGAFSL